MWEKVVFWKNLNDYQSKCLNIISYFYRITLLQNTFFIDTAFSIEKKHYQKISDPFQGNRIYFAYLIADTMAIVITFLQNQKWDFFSQEYNIVYRSNNNPQAPV